MYDHRNKRDMDGVTKELLDWEDLLVCKDCRMLVKIGQVHQLPFERLQKGLNPDRWVKYCPLCDRVYPEPMKVYQRGLADWE